MRSPIIDYVANLTFDQTDRQPEFPAYVIGDTARRTTFGTLLPDVRRAGVASKNPMAALVDKDQTAIKKKRTYAAKILHPTDCDSE